LTGRFAPLLWLAAYGVALGGCAHEAPEAAYPSAAAAGWAVPAAYAWPPSSVAPASQARGVARPAASQASDRATFALPETRSQHSSTPPVSVFAQALGNVPRPRARSELRAVLPGSSACLARLGEQGVRFHALDRELGVKTPIVVDGPIAGVRYYTGGNGPLLADCRLVLALALMGPELTAFGVSDARFSGAYEFRLSNKGRVSLHAYGLAIDLHGFTRFGVHYEVERDFRKGAGALSAEDLPPINGIARRFHASGLFHEYLTPDDNADHHDHVHVGVSPLPDEVQ
jgi:hypothetical protein